MAHALRPSLLFPVWLAAAGCLGPTSAAAQSAAEPSAPSRQASQIQAPRKAPLPNRVNEVLPSWLRVRGEFRERMEGVDGMGFDNTRDDLYWLSRFRVNASVTASPAFTVQLQVQDARVAKKTLGTTGTPFSAPFDLRMAFADVGATTGPVTLRVGRQELVYGEQRLVGHVSWLNAARTFDGAKLTLRGKGVTAEVFATSVVRILDGEFDRSGDGNWFTGAYVTTPHLGPHAIEPFVFWRRDRNRTTETATPGDLSQTTAGFRLTGTLPARLDYGVEMAVQRGSLGTDAVGAWAGHWQLRHSVPGRGTAKLTGEYNYATGDADPSDGIRGAFDQLYPTPHDKTGLADQIGWKNVHHVRAGFEFTPWRGLPITTNYHSWWLAETRDGVYSAGGLPVARVIAGAASRHVGQEVDVQAARAITSQMQLAAGYAHVFTGAFLKQATPGSSFSHPYVMVTYVFLSER